MAVMTECDPTTPGEILLEEFLRPMGLSQYRLAKELAIPAQRISAIVAGKRAIYRGHRPMALSVLRFVSWLLAAGAGCLRHRGCRTRDGAVAGPH